MQSIFILEYLACNWNARTNVFMRADGGNGGYNINVDDFDGVDSGDGEGCWWAVTGDWGSMF